jgi:DnaJ-class molecular chaperone
MTTSTPFGKIKLKERCPSCDGLGVYTWSTWYRRCWTCGGKGWRYNMMDDPKHRYKWHIPKDDEAYSSITGKKAET